MPTGIRAGASLRIIVVFWMGFSGVRREPPTGSRPRRTQMGAPWRDLPMESGQRRPVYCQFRRWPLAKPWKGILNARNHAGIATGKPQMADIEPVSATGSSEPARVIRTHHHAAGAKGALKEALGHSPGGFTTRSHRRVNGAGLPMWGEITPGQDSDGTDCDLVMADNLLQRATLVADRELCL